MREIKFRAWEDSKKLEKEIGIDRKENSLPNKIHLWTDILTYNKIWISQLLFGEFSSYITLMQFTGLKDKNGKEIFEGDVVNYDSKYIKSIDEGEFKNMIVVFLKCGFYLESRNKAHFHLGICYKSGECEVIGNIYENPELLEAKS